MGMLVADCPRCRSQEITFDVLSAVSIGVRREWRLMYEAFCCCRRCDRPTVFTLVLAAHEAREAFRDPPRLLAFPNALDKYFEIDGYISLKDEAGAPPPEHLPQDVETAFREAAACLAIGCYNASGAMFRLCIDLATKSFLPDTSAVGPAQPSAYERRNLAPRLRWLFANNSIPDGLKELSRCIKEDGDSGVHDGSLSALEADDLLDFTTALLQRLYTEPAKLKIAEERRLARRLKDVRPGE